MSPRRQVLLRLDPAVHDALIRWAEDEFRSVNAQVEVLIRRALSDAGRMPSHARPLPKRGRPRNEPAGAEPSGPEPADSESAEPASARPGAANDG